MGKPYAIELQKLSETYAWAMETTIDPLVSAISTSTTLPLVAVGSGGSYTAAHFACALHQDYSGMISRPLTPLEFVSSPLYLGNLSVMILSAGGTNPDIIGSLKNAVLREPRRCIVLCLRKGSALSRLAAAYRFIDLVDINLPSIKDGFLATNSLLAFAILLDRAYANAFSMGENLPRRLEDLLTQNHSVHPYALQLRKICGPLWKRETLLVLYGPSVHSAALDLESKFSEAALGNIQIVDFRNFAHGRHNWIAKRQSKTAILAIFTDADRDLAERTLRLIPKTIPIARLSVPGVGTTVGIAAIVAALHIVGLAGEAHRIDPGRPVVPAFGRQIYNLRCVPLSRKEEGEIFSPERVAVARKLGGDVRSVLGCRDFEFWGQAYRQFVESLRQASFSALVFDYDGTLCEERERFSGLGDDVIRHLTRILDVGIPVGIATGRGKSVRDDLRRKLAKTLWKDVYLGYYNGADLGNLSDDDHPEPPASPREPLAAAGVELAENPVLSAVAAWDLRRTQISVQPNSPRYSHLIWRILQEVANSSPGVKVLRSGHSVDLVLQEVSKMSVRSSLMGLFHEAANILSIGDRGEWPGNDHDLLSAPLSLSVDEVSADSHTCWNLAPPGHRGVQATLDYLKALRLSKREFTIDVTRITSGTSLRQGRG